jgi:C4-dicarboxylate transporter DctM subunit
MDLFLGGYIPGVMMGGALMIISFITAKKHNFPRAKRITLKQLVRCFIDALWALITPIIIVGGIVSGIFTPTEAGAVSCVYAFIVGWFFYKELSHSNIVSVLKDSAQTTGIVLLLVGTASVFSWILTAQRVPQTLALTLTTLSNNKIVILLIVNIITLIVGMFIDSTPSMLMLCPVFFPLMNAIGVDLVHFGVFFEINLCIGLLTPPVGSCMFVGCRIGQVSIIDILKPLYINIAVLLIVLLTIVYIPQLVLFLPSLVK